MESIHESRMSFCDQHCVKRSHVALTVSFERGLAEEADVSPMPAEEAVSKLLPQPD